MSETPQTNSEFSKNQVINNLDALFSKLEKDFPNLAEKFSALKEKLKEKYSNKLDNLFTITQSELQQLKENLQTNPNNLENFINEQIQEEKTLSGKNSDKIKENGTLEFLDNNPLLDSIKDEKLKEIVQDLDSGLEGFLGTYDFLGTNEKNILKLSIANQLMDSLTNLGGFSPEKMISDGKNLAKNLQETIDKKSENGLGNIKNITKPIGDFFSDKKETKSEESGLFDKIKIFEKLGNIKDNYEKYFNKIKEKFEKDNITDKQIQKNIISNISIFHNPKSLENFDEKLFNEILIQIDQIKNSEKINEYNIPKNTKDLEKYLKNSKDKLNDLEAKMQSSAKIQNMVMEVITSDPTGMMKGVLKWLLKLPIIGKLLGKFLSMSVESIDKDEKLFKTLKILESFGGKLTKNKQLEKNEFDSILKDKNLGELNFGKLKPFLNFINKNTKTKEEKQELIANIILGKEIEISKIKVSVKLKEEDFDSEKKPKNTFYEKLNNIESQVKEEKIKEKYQEKFSQKNKTSQKEEPIFEKTDIPEKKLQGEKRKKVEFKTKQIFGKETKEQEKKLDFNKEIIGIFEEIKSGNLKEGIKSKEALIKLENNILFLKAGEESRKFEIKAGKIKIENIIFSQEEIKIKTDSFIVDKLLGTKTFLKNDFIKDIEELLKNGFVKAEHYSIESIDI